MKPAAVRKDAPPAIRDHPRPAKTNTPATNRHSAATAATIKRIRPVSMGALSNNDGFRKEVANVAAVVVDQD